MVGTNEIKFRQNDGTLQGGREVVDVRDSNGLVLSHD